ncbi:unnamed protein product, partial [Rotaria sp. Silwood2]
MKNAECFSLVSNPENSINTNENYWECEECSINNEESIKRCQNCGKSRYGISLISADKIDNEKEYDQTLLSKLFDLVSSTNVMPTSDIIQIMTKQDLESLTEQDQQSFIETHFSYDQTKLLTESDVIVYISDVPTNIDHDDAHLANLIHMHLQKTFQIMPSNIQCYSSLRAGFMRVRNNKIKDRLVKDIKTIVLDLSENPSLISFNDTFEFTSYIVIDKTNENKDVDLPKFDEILKRWIKIYNGEKPYSCEQISIQFPNIYRIILTSFNNLLVVMSNPDFLINNLFAHVYLGANCSYLEDLPKSTTKEQLKEALCDSIQLKNLSPLSLHIELNKQTNN